jgi:hypothetical protein
MDKICGCGASLEINEERCIYCTEIYKQIGIDDDNFEDYYVKDKIVIDKVANINTHCWSCGSSISTQTHTLCEKCNRVVCDCSACLCNVNEVPQIK